MPFTVNNAVETSWRMTVKYYSDMKVIMLLAMFKMHSRFSIILSIHSMRLKKKVFLFKFFFLLDCAFGQFASLTVDFHLLVSLFFQL